ncbi:hypothetical protein [Microbacterium dextranolyticum]|uniref:Uncharacterized protein n=1 Tax=Microbacterium dextranolyticum TaxID=36806 RepID=A0A9W6M6L1_9MICO|nr:hypothetical protein [Microbacterium dextranolyticum]MBM7464088.1 hypothetical protein [Microbacterium dextranolyticum]GLJ96584.1 hypothetical protein GCM10017591_26470 [Microbacterium dextranolyticum]
MKRIDVHYGGNVYSIGGRSLAEVRAEIEQSTEGGGWLLVNDGEGAQRDAYLWITRGVPIAVIPIPDPMPEHD